MKAGKAAKLPWFCLHPEPKLDSFEITHQLEYMMFSCIQGFFKTQTLPTLEFHSFHRSSFYKTPCVRFSPYHRTTKYQNQVLTQINCVSQTCASCFQISFQRPKSEFGGIHPRSIICSLQMVWISMSPTWLLAPCLSSLYPNSLKNLFFPLNLCTAFKGLIKFFMKEGFQLISKMYFV